MSALNHCHLVRHDDGRRPLDPRLGAVRVDGGLRAWCTGSSPPSGRRPPAAAGARRLRSRCPGRPPPRSGLAVSVGLLPGGRAVILSSVLLIAASASARAAARRRLGVVVPSGRGPLRDSTMARAHSSRERRAMASSLSGRWPAMAIRYSSTATSARASVLDPSGVSRSSTRRRSVSSWRRSTRPRATSPSMRAVMEGRRTARRSARPEAAAEPSARIPRTRYWGRVSSTWANATSTRLESQAATRP